MAIRIEVYLENGLDTWVRCEKTNVALRTLELSHGELVKLVRDYTSDSGSRVSSATDDSEMRGQTGSEE